jgi:hypothetical protein
MGERGKNDEMKNRRTSVEVITPEAEKTASDQSPARDAMGKSVTPPHKPAARLGREVQARIGQQLRALYDDVVNEGVPQHINDLVRRLSEQE